MAFSGALTLTDLNDFITPSQACIKPVEQSNPEPTKDEGAASTQIHIDSSGSYYEVSRTDDSASKPSPRKLETAQISLNDCLACSGCITSAESVLITMQSHEEVLNVLSSNPPTICVDHKTTVLSIAPQSLASLAAAISSTSTRTVTLEQVLHRVAAFARSLGFEHIYDTTFARHLALLEHAREFLERKHGITSGGDAAGKLPMLASACPGWVCYAEKTHPEMLPFISRTKSPQQVMGTLVKNWLGEKWGKTPDQIYHVTVMPCYDKKLEASRQDFYNDIYSTRDVDCVITTGELELMMRERAWDLSQALQSEPVLSPTSCLPSASDNNVTPDEPADTTFPTLLTHPGTSSGSYLHTLISSHITSHPGSELTTRQIRGSDFEEYVVRTSETPEVLFKGARCYGFRNLQNVVRKVGRTAGVQVGRGAAGRLAAVRAKTKVKRRAPKTINNGTEQQDSTTQVQVQEEGEEDRPYDYVEVMACPGGCVNGGGQLRPILDSTSSQNKSSAETDPMNDARWGTRAWTQRVEQAYWHDLPTPPPSPPLPEDTILPKRLLSSNIGATPSARLQAADILALRILTDLCQVSTDFATPPKSWIDPMDDDAEKRRCSLFRTSYRAVVSEVSGIQVQW